jgi:hypothetical protein
MATPPTIPSLMQVRMIMYNEIKHDRRAGIALPMTLALLMAVAALATGALVIGSNHRLIGRHYEREGLLDIVANSGLEFGRARLNSDPTAYPDSGYATLLNGGGVVDGLGDTIPGLSQWLYAGPTGFTSGQYGVFGSVVSVVRDPSGGVAVRRREVVQESFARFAYFTDVEPSNISFGGGDQIFGPVHTNDRLKIYSSGATFNGPTRTASTVSGAQYGTFVQGYSENVPRIEMPETADLNKLRVQAAAGGTDFTSNSLGGAGRATLRIEFVALDLNGDGDTTDENEGFLRAYTSNDAAWVVADIPSGGMRSSANCGHYHADDSFVAAADHPTNGPDSWVAALSNSRRRCLLGGADSLSGAFDANDGRGSWIAWSGAIDPLVGARADASYLFPISRALNPSFKGVIFVDGRVAISGTLRGRVTVAATDDIIIADDVRYATDPALNTCEDILGIFGGDDVVVADNTINAPVRPANGQNYFTYDDTKDEFIHGIVLALDVFTVDNYAGGSTRAERCEGQLWGRGCLYLTGGIIQRTRGAVATLRSPGGTGNLKRYSYDTCAATQPPPYFPTTGRFSRGRYYQLDPTGFSIDALFDLLAVN